MENNPTSPNQYSPTHIIITTVVITIFVIGGCAGLFYLGYTGAQRRHAQKSESKRAKTTAQSTQLQTRQNQQTQTDTGGDEHLDTDAAYQQAMKNPEYIPPSGWKKYTTKDTAYSFYYPPDWTITDESKNVDIYNDGNIQFQNNIKISKNGYTFVSFNPIAWGPSGCYYPDTNPPPADGPGSGNLISEYQEIIGNDGVYRRPQSSDYEVPNIGLRWFLCKKQPDNSFVGVAGFGSTYYDTPASYDPTMIIIMDQILESFQKQ